MKKTFLCALAAVAALLTAGCQKEEPTAQDPQEGGIKLTIENFEPATPESKSAVSGAKVGWADGERVYVKPVQDGVSRNGQSFEVADNSIDSYFFRIYSNYNFAACHPHDLVGRDQMHDWDFFTVTIPSQYDSRYEGGRQIIGLPMLAHSTAQALYDGTLVMKFYHLTGAVLVRVKNETGKELRVSSVKVKMPGAVLAGQKSVRFNHRDEVVDNPDGLSGNYTRSDSVVVTLDASARVEPGQILDVQVPVIHFDAAGNLQITVHAYNPLQEGAVGSNTEYVFSHTATCPAIGRNKMLEARLKINPNSGRVSTTRKGVFSVSNSKKVYFSRGNLQYRASSNTFRFAERQYDHIGSNEGNTVRGFYNRKQSTSWIDLYGWGSSGCHPYGQYVYHEHEPWYAGGYNEYHWHYGPHEQGADPSNFLIFDWGHFNPIHNGGNQAGTWRTLTAEEWGYLIGNTGSGNTIRTGRTGACTITGEDGEAYRGVILFPDNYAPPQGFVPRLVNFAYAANTYTYAQWRQLEEEGCVFLPAAGRRPEAPASTASADHINVNYTVEHAGNDGRCAGYYWTAETSRNENKRAYMLQFDEYNGYSGLQYTYRSVGAAVRLVVDAD